MDPLASGGGVAPPSVWPPAGRAWTMVAVLTVAYAFAFVDRQILTLLVEPIKLDLSLSDTQFSLLTGLAFTLFYTMMGVPFAWIADRGSRRDLAAASMVLWSAMTAACGLASGFVPLVLARIGVGVGEAGLSPAAYSMIADSFPPDKRARPMGVYNVGAITGVGLALLIGGAVVQWASHAPPLHLPGAAALKSWQLALIIVGLPGPFLALAMWAIREPRRQGAGETPAGSVPAASLQAYVRTRGRLFLLLALGFSLLGSVTACYLTWGPAFMMRAYGWDAAQVGTTYGLILLTFSPAGIIAGAAWADRLASRGHADALLTVSLASGVLGLPFALAAPFAPTGGLAMGALAAMSFAFGLSQGLPAPALQAIAPNRLRARVIAVYLLMGNLIAFTLAPTLVAMISDLWIRDPAKIGVALAAMSAVVAPLGMLALRAARSEFVRAAQAELGLAAHSPAASDLAVRPRPVAAS